MTVITRDIPDPLTGDLDGQTIHVDYLLTAEERLFLLAHLFGHTAQWNLSPEGYALGQPQQPPVGAELLRELIAHEEEAAAYALAMLLSAGIIDLDHWLSDYAACDAAYLTHYYLTGEKGRFEDFRQRHVTALAHRRVPPFTPVRRPPRADGIVI